MIVNLLSGGLGVVIGIGIIGLVHESRQHRLGKVVLPDGVTREDDCPIKQPRKNADEF